MLENVSGTAASRAHTVCWKEGCCSCEHTWQALNFRHTEKISQHWRQLLRDVHALLLIMWYQGISYKWGHLSSPADLVMGWQFPSGTWPSSTSLKTWVSQSRPSAVGATLIPAEGAASAWWMQDGFGHLAHCSFPSAARAQLCTDTSLSLQENQYYFQLCASNQSKSIFK